jgi:alkylhydroperoxidase family enzyme
MSDIGSARKALVVRILEGEGRASRAQRRAAFDNSGLTGPVGVLVEKVCKRAHEVTDDDVAAARASNLSEDEVFEIVVCAAVGEATRQLESALAAIRTASTEG